RQALLEPRGDARQARGEAQRRLRPGLEARGRARSNAAQRRPDRRDPRGCRRTYGEGHLSVNQTVRDAMIPEPQTLEADATAQEAGEHLTQPEVRAVYVCDDGRFVGVLTRKTLVREVVAAGRDPRETKIGEIAEPAHWTLDSELPLDEAFQFLEEQDAERVPVVDDGKLVGVLSRSVLQRRLAEDEPPPALEDA